MHTDRTALDVLTRARLLISPYEKWTQNAMARDEKGESVPAWDSAAKQFCAYGAMCHCVHKLMPPEHEVNTAYRITRLIAQRVFSHDGIENMNDVYVPMHRTEEMKNVHKEVLDMFDFSIAWLANVPKWFRARDAICDSRAAIRLVDQAITRTQEKVMNMDARDRDVLRDLDRSVDGIEEMVLHAGNTMCPKGWTGLHEWDNELAYVFKNQRRGLSPILDAFDMIRRVVRMAYADGCLRCGTHSMRFPSIMRLTDEYGMCFICGDRRNLGNSEQVDKAISFR